jgi:Protein of unknown function (DUF935)
VKACECRSRSGRCIHTEVPVHAAVARPSASVFTEFLGPGVKSGSGGFYQPSVRDRQFFPSGRSFSPNDILGFLVMAEGGDPRYLFSFFYEMLARDPLIRAENAKGRNALRSARYKFMVPKNFRGKKDAGATEVLAYVKEQLDAPHVGMRRACAHVLWNGFTFGIGALETEVEANATPEGRERLVALRSITPIRFRLDVTSPDWLFQPTGDANRLFAVPAYGDALSLFIPEDDIPYPVRRGIYRTIIAHALTRMYGPGWWVRVVQNFGTPFRIGKYPLGDLQSRDELLAAMKDLGTLGYGAQPNTSTIEFITQGIQALSNPPQRDLMEWNGEQITIGFHGHLQATGRQSASMGGASTTTAERLMESNDRARAAEGSDFVREQIVRPLVFRNFGPERAEIHTPDVLIDIDEVLDLAAFSGGIAAAQATGVVFSRSQVYDKINMDQPEDEEDTLKPVVPPPPVAPGGAAPFGKGAPGKPGQPPAKPGQKPAPVTATPDVQRGKASLEKYLADALVEDERILSTVETVTP